MFYSVNVKDHVRVDPSNFDLDIKESIVKSVKEKYTGYIDKDTGIVIDVLDVKEIGDGVIIPGDGASYYETTFQLLSFEPEQHEVLPGYVRDIADFGAFLNLGPIDGMIHVSQTMNDFVSFTKDKVLQGKDTNRSLKVGDKCVAKVVAISYKDIANPKIGLTMRREGLGKQDWVEEDLNKKKK